MAFPYGALTGSYINTSIGPDVFFEIIYPPELEYTYKLRPAKDFGAPFVSIINILELIKILQIRTFQFYLLFAIYIFRMQVFWRKESL